MLFSLFTFLPAFAGKISGNITNQDGEPLPFASISIKGTTLGTTANSMGEYFLVLSPGTYTLICQHVGFERLEKKITVDPRTWRAPVYFIRVLCPVRRRAQTCALSLNDDHGDAAEAGCASPPRSGKPDGLQAFPLEPWVQGRLARIAMAEDVPTSRGPCRRGIGPVFLTACA